MNLPWVGYFIFVLRQPEVLFLSTSWEPLLSNSCRLQTHKTKPDDEATHSTYKHKVFGLPVTPTAGLGEYYIKALTKSNTYCTAMATRG